MSSNRNVVLIMGKPSSGKSTSLRNLENPERMVYLNTDMKELPFPDKFAVNAKIDQATDVLGFIDQIEANEKIDGAILDTITFLMSMYERQFVITSKDTQKAWGNYGMFYRDLLHKIKAGTKDYAILAHAADQLNESEMIMDVSVPVKGAVGKTGVEADFTTILATKRMPIAILKEHPNDLLVITPEEEEDGFKYVFQTRIDKSSMGEKMRSALGLWKREEKYIDNDLNKVFKRLHEYK